MGNSASSLEEYRVYFDDPKIGDLDLNSVKVYKIDDEKSAEVAEEFLEGARTLYVDCEGHYFGNPEQKLATVQVATGPGCCLVFHIIKYRKSLSFLKKLFESDEVRKVFHDCSGDSAVLFHENRIQLTNRSVDDTQIAHKVIESTQKRIPIDRTTGHSLSNLYKIYCGKNIPGNKRINKNSAAVPGGNMWTDNEELTPRMIKYAVVDALSICEVFTIQRTMLIRTAEYKALVNEKLQAKIKPPKSFPRESSAQLENSTSSNWGLFAAGAAALVLGAAAAAAVTNKNEKDKREESRRMQNDEQQKKDECIIS